MNQPQRFGRYELLSELARGGMGAVYRARDPELGREVALKVITTPLDAEALARFKLEGEAAARVRHPNVLRVHERGVHQGRPYLVMDLAAGSLKERLRRSGPMPGPEAARLLAPVAEALAAIHAAQILHRDLKPENVLLSETGEPLLADFGIAKAVDRETRYTQSGALLGSPAYMAPEQVQGGALGVGVDVYGLGGVLYELLTGRPPFVAGSVMGVLQAVLAAPPAPPGQLVDGLDPKLEALCLRCLEKDPRDRFPDMQSLAEALRGASQASAPRRRPWIAALAGLLVVSLLLAAGSFAFGSAEPTPSPPALPRDLQVSQIGSTGRDGTFQLLVQLPEALQSPGTLVVSSRRGEPQTFEFPPGDQLRLSLRSPRSGRTTWEVALSGTSYAGSLAVECDLPDWYLKLPDPPPLLEGLDPGPRAGEYLNAADGSVMCWIPPGSALAAVPGELGEVEVTTGFYLGKYEVTTAQVRAYRRWLLEKELGPGQRERPAGFQSFHDATRYCRWAGGRLPTISEWNLAALGDAAHRRRYPWGASPPSPAHGIQTEERNPPRVHRMSDRTPEGVHGLGGGVSEWVADVVPERAQGLPPDYAEPSSPPEPYLPSAREAGRLRELRGASFIRGLDSADARYHPPRPAVRRRPPPDGQADWRGEQGFRLVRSPLRPEPEHLEWEVRFKSFAQSPSYLKAKRGPGPEVPLQDWPQLTRKVRLLRDPWIGVLPKTLMESFVTWARTEVELPPGRWVFSVIHADDGVRMKVRAGEQILGEVDAWIHQVAGHHEVAFALEETTTVQVEVEHCEFYGAEGLWVELSRE